MSRAPFQVLVLPYRLAPRAIQYALFRRADGGGWQGIAGGGEGAESPLEAARREAAEEAGIAPASAFLPLDSRTTVPAVDVTGELTWGEDALVVVEHCFGVAVGRERLRLSREHTELIWTDYATARGLCRWDSNRNALWELNHRLTRDAGGAPPRPRWSPAAPRGPEAG